MKSEATVDELIRLLATLPEKKARTQLDFLKKANPDLHGKVLPRLQRLAEFQSRLLNEMAQVNYQ